MSQHPSLLGGAKGKQHRSVLKRYEKLKYLIEKEKWDEKAGIYNLPKIKAVKFKAKKEKAAAPAEAEAAAAAPGAPAAAAAPGAAVKGKATAAAKTEAPQKDKKSKP